MIRARFSLMALGVAGLGLLAGCANTCGHHHLASRRANRAACCCETSMPCCDTGPMMGGPMIMSPPVNGTIIPSPTPIPQTTMPPLAPPPANGRIVPQPQSQPMPYNPPGTATSRF